VVSKADWGQRTLEYIPGVEDIEEKLEVLMESESWAQSWLPIRNHTGIELLICILCMYLCKHLFSIVT
jgi:hypothetical protein